MYNRSKHVEGKKKDKMDNNEIENKKVDLINKSKSCVFQNYYK